MEMRLPQWVRLVVLVSAVMQLGFGVTLLYDPECIGDLWPWPLPPLTTRLLGASTLVSIPLALIAIGVNRFGVAMIPLVMLLTYRVLQLAAGLIHFDRFQGVVQTVNYFGGGTLLMVVFAYTLWAGLNGRLPAAAPTAPLAQPRPWGPSSVFRRTVQVLGVGYVALGLAFLILGVGAGPMWIDAAGIGALTARLFSSPLIGLGLGLLLVSRARDWREAVGPAAGMVTIGVLGMLALGLSIDTLAPPSVLAWAVAATPLILLLVGARILAGQPEPQPAAAAAGKGAAKAD